MQHQKRWLEVNSRLLGPDGLPGIVNSVQRRGLFGEWQRSSRPPYGHDLAYAVEVACSDPFNPYVELFRDYALQVLDRARSDKPRWAEDADWGKPPLGPGYWYETVVLYEQAAAWKADAEIEAAAVLAACRSYVATAPALKGNVLWNSCTQTQMLTVVLWLLYFDEVAEAKQALALRRSYRYTARFHGWVQGLAQRWPAVGVVASDEALLHFDTLYDEVRDPDWRKQQPSFREQEAAGESFPNTQSLFRLQLALLRRRLQRRPLAAHWSTLIDEMSA